MTRGSVVVTTQRRTRRDRTEAAAAAAAFMFFGYVALRGAGFPAPLGLGTQAGLGLLLVAAAVAGATRLRRVFWTVGVVVAAVLLLVGVTPLIRGPAHALVRADPWPAEGVQAVVVLSASLTDDGQLSAIGADRLLTGLAVARRHDVATVVTSRITRNVGGATLTSDADQRALLALGAPAARLATVAPVATTRDEAVQVARLARDAGWRRVAVVTSPSHTRRACAAFERVGFEVTCVPAVSRTVAWNRLGSLRDRLQAATNVLYETLATALYRRRGWV